MIVSTCTAVDKVYRYLKAGMRLGQYCSTCEHMREINALKALPDKIIWCEYHMEIVADLEGMISNKKYICPYYNRYNASAITEETNITK